MMLRKNRAAPLVSCGCGGGPRESLPSGVASRAVTGIVGGGFGAGAVKDTGETGGAVGAWAGSANAGTAASATPSAGASAVFVCRLIKVPPYSGVVVPR